MNSKKDSSVQGLHPIVSKNQSLRMESEDKSSEY